MSSVASRTVLGTRRARDIFRIAGSLEIFVILVPFGSRKYRATRLSLLVDGSQQTNVTGHTVPGHTALWA